MKSIIRMTLLSMITFFIFTTCDSPMGMGKQIDWEAPVLTLDPKPPTPMYVRLGAQLTGTVTDNVAVDRVILRDAVTGEQLFTAILLPNDRWVIDLVFSEEQNGETITVDVVAFDTAGNSNASSIAQVVLVIDIRPPLVKYIEIKRTDTRISRPESYEALKDLEKTDERGEKKDNLYRYQNGWFYMSAVVDEDETKIDYEFTSLNIYDTREPNILLLSLPIDEGYTAYNPRWTVKEEDLINAGVSVFGQSYKTNYYEEGERYYYRVVVYAIDKSQNISVIIQEDEGYICLWVKSDDPKGIYDPSIGKIVSRGTPLPVDFFDDDSLSWAFTGLLTKEQWDGFKWNDSNIKEDVYVASGAKIPEGSDERKLLWLKERLTGSLGESIELGAGQPVYNWRYDRYGDTSEKDARVKEQIEGKSLDEKVVYLNTGREENDYGDFVVFTITADKKLPPHDGAGPEKTNINRWKGRADFLSVIDENVPLIVFDVENGCPEENTFPKLFQDGGPGNEYFTIKGYTLRENSRGLADPTPGNQNKVTIFRMAWIPFNMPGPDGKPAADSYIKAVERALAGIKDSNGNIVVHYPTSIDSDLSLQGIQHWEFREYDQDLPAPDESITGYGNFTATRLYDEIEGSYYYKQDFEKKFSVLKNKTDSIKGAYKNFTYNGNHENETKLFIFYALDNMGHEVYRQLRLLGMKTPPSLTVYDITNKLDNAQFLGTPGLPDPNTASYTSGGILTSAYYTALNSYNRLYGNDKLKGVTYNNGDRSQSLQVYPRGSILKYWVTTAETGEMQVKSVTMKDITFTTDTDIIIGSNYLNTNTQEMSFCEYYPDVTRRTFLFEAEDELGNKAQVQRTVTVTNAARLENITTTEQSGLYGYDQKITLKANFSSQIYVTGGTESNIQLNLRYEISGTKVYRQIPCDSLPTATSPALSLDFTFSVPENASGTLWTVYDSATEFPSGQRHPITLSGGVKIMDAIRGDSAFIPDYQFDTVLMPNWTNNDNTLQKTKTITLDGTPPTYSAHSIAVTPSGKTLYSETPSGYFLKTGDTLELTLTASEQIKAVGAPVLQYFVRPYGTTTEYGPFTAAFKYKQPGAANTMLIFSLPITPTNFTLNGTQRDEVQIVRISLISADTIKDNANNSIVLSGVTNLTPTPQVYVKQNPSGKPVSEISPQATNAGTSVIGDSPRTRLNYNGNPTLTIDTAGTWPIKREYSVNGGNTWNDYNPSTPPGLANGSYTVQARVEDRAGNKGAITEQDVQVKGNFPKLLSVGATQPNGWYKEGSSLVFNLTFEDEVTVLTRENVAIRLTNASATIDPAENENRLIADTGQTTPRNTITFTWSNVSGYEMQSGLYISSIVLDGLSDRFGNRGKNNTGIGMNTAISGIDGSPVQNLPAGGIKVDGIDPTYTINVPKEGVIQDTDNKKIILTFRENVMIGSGIITVKPYGNYKIPAVLENNGYTNSKGTYIAGFYDIYNNSALTAADRQTLTLSTNATNPSMGSLALDERSGQSAGPYIKLTHGLKEGAGFTGNYNNTTPGVNGPSPSGSFLIPDTATKWVLDYRYSIDNASNTQYANTSNVLTTPLTTVVPAIRAVLTKAKWRWQEIPVTNSNIVISGSTVTITLSEPLLDGLQWELTVPKGAFIDVAGNEAGALASDYWFWSRGVQAPVIRVNRKSFDARTTDWADSMKRNYSVPTDLGGPGGWGIGDFKTVYYRIESETPGATITYATEIGTASNNGSINIPDDWTGTIANGRTWDNPLQYNGTNTSSNGDWVMPNLVLRARNGSTGSYTVTENGFTTTRTLTANYAGYRSYNRDVTKSYLDGLSLSAFSGSGTPNNPTQNYFTYTDRQASKNYVVARATVRNGGTDYTSDKSYEGVFRSVIALKQDTFAANLNGINRDTNPIMVQGSNVKNGMPSISGFPVYDAGESGDNRFVKLYYYESFSGSSSSMTNGRLYWVSTEIVSQWYNLSCGYNKTTNTNSGGTHSQQGDVNNYLYSGYGDLSYAYNLR